MDELTANALAAAGGDRVALSAFVRLSQADVWRLCAHLVDRESADDLTQDVYCRAVEALPSYRAAAPARTWLLSIAYRTCADCFRRRQRRRLLLGKLRAAPEAAGAPADTVVHAKELLANRDADQRAAVALTQVLGLRYHEAAAVLAVPVGTVRSRVSRGRAVLADLVADDRGTGSSS